MSRSLQLLTEDAERITELDFSGKPPKESPVAEFATLSRAFAMMKDTVLTRTRELESAQAKLGHLVEIGIAMAGESHIGQMIELILREAETISGADGGTLFLMTGDRKALTFEFIHNTSLDLAIGGTQAAEFELPTMPYLDPATGEPRLDDVVCAAIHRARAIAVADVYADPRFDFTRLHEFDRRTGYRSRSLLVVPLNPRGGKVIGAIQLINAHRGKVAEPVAFSDGVRRHVEALAAQAANALYNRSLLDAQEALVDGMVKVIAGAIDTKSPYTGAHCLRVPELAVMLAEEASKVETGPLAGFAFTTEAEWREFRIGAWLHDCGKVTTPEYLVDKATKLETIHNRIHEVRTRFEVLLRDATIARLEAVAAGADPVAVEAAFERRRRQLADDFAFVAECNVGGEVMAADKVERLKRIGATPWQRHFDDRLGLSHEELRRLEAVPEQPLPAEETLLADRPEQVMPWSGGEQHFDPAFGFTLTVPPVMFDRGEMHNLSVPRGTLTEEERFKITEHAVQTVVMLEGLPFPDHLRRVPEYAGTHHETLDGKGYPRSLSARDLSVPARIMTIADIFEALTASDRPYKKAKTLSEAVAILDGLRRRGHVDSDLFELFLTSGAYRRYGERFLSPEQLDSVDVPAYLS
ncbi:MAG: GAF domain-containing protein [Magnetospirillum sp.]|nr:GAF domain-containing protein [Magnetospirillum sp.]